VASHWLTRAASSGLEDVNLDVQAECVGGESDRSAHASCRVGSWREGGWASIPVKYPQIFPLGSSGQRNSNPTRQNSRLIFSASSRRRRTIAGIHVDHSTRVCLETSPFARARRDPVCVLGADLFRLDTSNLVGLPYSAPSRIRLFIEHFRVAARFFFFFYPRFP
jgi:hypothetical protein